VGPILDLAVVILAVAVTVSLALLAWTLAVSAAAAARQTRESVLQTRLGMAGTERRLRKATAAAYQTLRRLADATDRRRS
jgi:hypothetical protein